MKAHFDSVCEYVHEALNPVRNRAGWATWEHYNDADWAGMGGPCKLSDVAETTTTGWQAGADKLIKAQESMDIPRLPSIRRHAVWSDRGDEIDMPRVYSGRLDSAWRRTQKSKASSGVPRVRIVADCMAAGSVNAEDMFWRGAAAVILCDALTAAGYAVEMLSAFHGSDHEVSVTVKPFNGPCAMTDLAATTASPAFFRIIGHAFVAGHFDQSGNGSMSVHSIEEWPSDDVAKCFIVPHSITTREECAAWVAKSVLELDQAKAA